MSSTTRGQRAGALDGEARTTVFTGGRVLVLDGTTPPAEAVVMRGGRLTGVGSDEEMSALGGPHAERVDLRGSTVMPGLVDTHPHLLHFGAFSYPLVDIADARSHADILERIRAHAATTEPGQWIMTTPVGEAHYFIRRSYRDLEERALPDRHILDTATPVHPVFIQAWAPVVPNVCAFNSAALAALRITRATPDRVQNVSIEKDGHGEPTGILRGSVNNYYTNDSFMNELLRKVPLLQLHAVMEGTQRAMADYNRLGVTTVYEGHGMGAAEIGAYRVLRSRGDLRVRVLTSFEAESHGLPGNQALSMDQFRHNLEVALSMTALSDDLLRSNGVTLSRGGPCWPGFLRMHQPYRGPYGEPTRGTTFVSGEKEEVAIEFCAAHGLRLNFIGAGDRDHDEFLERAEAVAHRYPIAALGWILQHAYLLTQEQARRYAALGFRVTTSMSFSWGKGDLLGARIGRHVWKDLVPLRRLLAAGMLVGCGSDWGPKNIFEHVELAVTHRFCGSGHQNLGPAQPVTREEALLMWTRDAAAVLGWDGIGTLRPGNHADLIVVDRDPLTCALDDLARTQVLRTLVAGRTVYDSGAL